MINETVTRSYHINIDFKLEDSEIELLKLVTEKLGRINGVRTLRMKLPFIPLKSAVRIIDDISML